MFKRKPRNVYYGSAFVPTLYEPNQQIASVLFDSTRREVDIEEVNKVAGGYEVLFSWIE